MQVSQSGAGQKYIAVFDQGNLQIHGQEKLHWTKLSATVERYNADPTQVFYDHMVRLFFQLSGRKLIIIIIEDVTG